MFCGSDSGRLQTEKESYGTQCGCYVPGPKILPVSRINRQHRNAFW